MHSLEDHHFIDLADRQTFALWAEAGTDVGLVKALWMALQERFPEGGHGSRTRWCSAWRLDTKTAAHEDRENAGT